MNRAPRVLTIMLICGFTSSLFAQDETKEAESKSQPTNSSLISTIDPVDILPEVLTTPVSYLGIDERLEDFAKQIESQIKSTVIVDWIALSDEGISPDEPITAIYQDKEPLYLILDRILSRIWLGYYVEDDLLFITSRLALDDYVVTKTYAVNKLLAKGISAESLLDTIHSATSGPWEDLEGVGGTASILNGVLICRQTYPMHYELQALLQALASDRTNYVMQPESHTRFDDLLNQRITVDWVDVPLGDAMEDLQEQLGIRIVLDEPSLADEGLSSDEPVTVTLKDLPLKILLKTPAIAGLQVHLIPRRGHLELTTQLSADEVLFTAVYHVGDICPGDYECEQLISTLQNETEGPWEEIEGVGGVIKFPHHKLLVIEQTVGNHLEVQQLLEGYRSLITYPDDYLPKLITRYYKMDAEIADALVEMLPKKIDPLSWDPVTDREMAKIEYLPSEPRTLETTSLDVELPDFWKEASDKQKQNRNSKRSEKQPGKLEFKRFALREQAVLAIKQTRDNHSRIDEFIRKAKTGQLDNHIPTFPNIRSVNYSKTATEYREDEGITCPEGETSGGGFFRIEHDLTDGTPVR